MLPQELNILCEWNNILHNEESKYLSQFDKAKLLSKWYATEAIKLLERVVNTTSMQNIADLEDDITKFLDEYYNQENEE